ILTFLTSPPAPHAIHSFPTRRSSDLGHAGYSDPLDEQHFLVDTINRLQKLPTWNSTAVIIAYDDSDGWYDHVMGPIVSQSNDPRSEEHTSELQSRFDLVCRLLLEKKK